jgi:acetyl-CoA C-acetyltransferase
VHDKTGPSQAVVVGRLDGTGERFLANTHDEDDRTLHSMLEEDPLSASIHVRSFEYGNRFVFAKPSR